MFLRPIDFILPPIELALGFFFSPPHKSRAAKYPARSFRKIHVHVYSSNVSVVYFFLLYPTYIATLNEVARRDATYGEIYYSDLPFSTFELYLLATFSFFFLISSFSGLRPKMRFQTACRTI